MSEAHGSGSARGLRASVSALQHRNYRLLWTGNTISPTGDWMDQIAFSWLVYDMTGSTVYLALVNVCRALPILVLTLFAGVIADRMERRRMIFLTQAVMMLIALLLSALLTTGLLTLWMVFAIATARGITNTFNQPARQALISDLVPKDDLPSAVALNSSTHNLSKVVGPAVSGVLIATIGVAGAFYVNTVSIGVALYCIAIMRVSPVEGMRRAPDSMVADLAAGMAYLRGEKALRTLVILALVPMVLGQPYQTMLAVFARDVFDAGSVGLGVLQSTAAIGALAGIFVVATSRGSTRLNSQMVVGLIAYGLALTLFAMSPTIWLGLPLLFAVGLAQHTYLTSNNTLIQMNVAPEFRGRVLSTLHLQRGLVPLGTMVAGVSASAVGPQYAIGAMALSLLIIGAIAAPVVLRSAKKLGAPAKESHGGDAALTGHRGKD